MPCQSLSDGGEAKLFEVEVLERNPLKRRDIIEVSHTGTPFDTHFEEKIDGAAHDARIGIAVGLTEEVVQVLRLDLQTGFLLYLAAHPFFGRLVEVEETAHHVACPLGGIVGTTTAEDFALIVDYHSDGSTARIGIICKATILAMPCLWAMLHKAIATAQRAEVEAIERMSFVEHRKQLTINN